MSDEWNEAQGRINMAGEVHLRHAASTADADQGILSALLGLTEVIRQVGIEMLGVDTTIYSMEESAEELAAPETLYVGGEDVTQRYGLREDVVRAIDKGVEDGTIFADSHLGGPKPADGWFEPPEHWCPKERQIISGFKSECKEEH